MKTRKLLTFTFFLFFSLIFFTQFVSVRPTVTIKNSTAKKLYIYTNESVYGVEPDPEEVDKIVKTKPEVIEPGAEFKFIPSYYSLVKQDSVIDIGWRLGGQYEHNSTGAGRKNILLSSGEGVCAVSIIVTDGFNNYIAEGSDSFFCLKKMKFFDYKY